MKNQKSFVLLLFIVHCSLFIGLSSCSIFKKSEKNDKKTQIINIFENTKNEATNLLIEGKKEEINGNYENAIEQFKKCISKDPDNGACKYELANIYFQKKNYNSAIELLKDAVNSDPNNEWYMLQLAKTYEQVHQFDNASKVYLQLLKVYPDRYDFYYDLASIYITANKYKDAIKTYDDIESRVGVNEELSLQKKNLFLAINKLDKAQNEIQKLIDKYPKEIKYYNLKADMYLANKQPDKAFPIYQKILDIAPEDPNVHLSLAEYYRLKGDKVKSFNELKTAFGNSKLSIDPKLAIMLSYFSVSENYTELKPQAYELTQILIKTHPNEPKVYILYGDFLERDEKLKEAREQYQKSISLDSSQFSVWEELMKIELTLKDYNQLKKESGKAIELFPLQPVPYFWNGAVDIMLKKFSDALTPLKKGAEITQGNDDLLSEFYSNLGDAYNELKNYKASDSAYEKALTIKPDNDGVLNNYAYFLSLRGEKLKKAEEMAGKAVELSPDSQSYLDTYGWVLYKEDKLDKAKEEIEKALDKGGTKDDVILEHYGDILYKTGHIDKAIEYWKKAKEIGKGTDFLDKKITEGKLFE